MSKEIIIGLFGTCGGSKWRDIFMKFYNANGIKYFNPLKDDWKSEDAEIEAEHLANDDIILFPVTNETLAIGSLAETGFSILQAIRMDSQRDVIVMIEPDVIPNDNLTPNQIKDSVRTRALVLAHLKKLKYPNVHIVKDLDNMLALSLHLYKISVLKKQISEYTIHYE